MPQAPALVHSHLAHPTLALVLPHAAHPTLAPCPGRLKVPWPFAPRELGLSSRLAFVDPKSGLTLVTIRTVSIRAQRLVQPLSLSQERALVTEPGESPCH